MLDWPRENVVNPNLTGFRWLHALGNCILDFHGDPQASQLRVFSDGNHHMALEQALEAFRSEHDLHSVFYCTTPPKVYLDWLRQGAIEIGNLRLSVKPEIVIAPDDIMEKLCCEKKVSKIAVFAQSVGNSILLPKSNPKNIHHVQDLLRDDVRLFLSNPQTESASHAVYRQTLEGFVSQAELGSDKIRNLLAHPAKVMYGELIHHREAPQAVADGAADAALVYDHLALRYVRIFPDIFERVRLPAGPINITTRYAIGIADENCPLAQQAFEFFQSAQTEAIYVHHGLAGAH